MKRASERSLYPAYLLNSTVTKIYRRCGDQLVLDYSDDLTSTLFEPLGSKQTDNDKEDEVEKRIYFNKLNRLT